MKAAGLILLLVAVPLISITAAADQFTMTAQLPDPGILPGDGLYWLDILIERTRILLAPDQATELRLQFASERLAEALAVSNSKHVAMALAGYHELITGLEAPGWHSDILVRLSGNPPTKTATEITIRVV